MLADSLDGESPTIKLAQTLKSKKVHFNPKIKKREKLKEVKESLVSPLSSLRVFEF